MEMLKNLKKRCVNAFSNAKERCVNAFDNVKARVNNAKLVGGTVLMVVTGSALADDPTTIEQIGKMAAVEIAKFAIAISAVGAAVLSIIVIIQGFRMVFGMVKTAR